MESPVFTLSPLHVHGLVAFRAIEMWYQVVYRCRILTTGNHEDEYRAFLSNVLRQPDTETVERHMKKAIADFYHYFYTQKNIVYVNYNRGHLLTDDYAQFGSIYAGLNTGREGAELKNILREVTYYTFECIVHFRKEWGLFVFDDENQDEYISRYYTDYNERKME